MAAQDEGQVPFSKLPLSELKRWLEDWMDLPGQGILSGIGSIPGGGPTTIIQQPTDHEHFPGKSIPKWLGWRAQERAFTVNNVYFTRFKVFEAATVASLGIVQTVGINAADAWDFGIYNAAGTSLLGSSGVVTNPSQPVTPGILELPMQANFDLDPDTWYIFAILQTAAGGGANNYIYCDFAQNFASIYDGAGNGFGDSLVGQVTSGTPYTVLPADLSTGTYAHSNVGPWGLINPGY